MRFNPEEYITVHERVEKFYAKYPQGRITTSILEHDAETGFVLMRAEVFRNPDDAQPAATGHAYEIKSSGHVQQGSYVEVCETSSVGRALAMLGFEVRRGIASREEMQKAARKQQPAPPAPRRAERPVDEPPPGVPPKARRNDAEAAPPPAAPEAGPRAEAPAGLDELILQAAGELGYDAAKVRKWVNNKFEVSGGLGSLTDPDKQEVLKLFREQAVRAADKPDR
ncbi:MAG TPA: hypothetical protein VEY09_06915 [Pyrinomonadaceae bacterium]|nr:hypothetical protein [Pyrinomonadaceae bacterium]